MMTKSGAKTLEYNVRFGDPETQSLFALMKTDLASIMLACTGGNLGSQELEVLPKSAVTVVVAAGGYPGSYAKGIEMKLDPVSEGKLLDTSLQRVNLIMN
jgi:phosphoribosylamine--glycine ligase/phosphoribosylformylglycinamidine cyclo-ligase